MLGHGVGASLPSPSRCVRASASRPLIYGSSWTHISVKLSHSPRGSPILLWRQLSTSSLRQVTNPSRVIVSTHSSLLPSLKVSVCVTTPRSLDGPGCWGGKGDIPQLQEESSAQRAQPFWGVALPRARRHSQNPAVYHAVLGLTCSFLRWVPAVCSWLDHQAHLQAAHLQRADTSF